jgi:hypothetical protein
MRKRKVLETFWVPVRDTENTKLFLDTIKDHMTTRHHITWHSHIHTLLAQTSKTFLPSHFLVGTLTIKCCNKKGYFVRDWNKQCRPLVRELFVRDLFRQCRPLSWHTRYKVLHWKGLLCASLEQEMQTPRIEDYFMRNLLQQSRPLSSPTRYKVVSIRWWCGEPLD